MSQLEIRKYPDSVLRKASQNLEAIGEDERRAIDNMIEAMHSNQGIGLAAPQVGISKRIAVVDAGEGLLKMVNPRIVAKKGVSSLEEGCLSVSKKTVTIKRAEEITVSYTDESDKRQIKNFKGLTARAIQHEIDHLNGKLIIDYLPWYRRIFIKCHSCGSRNPE